MQVKTLQSIIESYLQTGELVQESMIYIKNAIGVNAVCDYRLDKDDDISLLPAYYFGDKMNALLVEDFLAIGSNYGGQMVFAYSTNCEEESEYDEYLIDNAYPSVGTMKTKILIVEHV